MTKRKYTRHGMHKTPLYNVWTSMKARCQSPTNPAYDRYGGRGIQVCKEWSTDFLTFFHWAKQAGYKKGLTLDRIDNDGNYQPSNCRFIPSQENMRNTSRKQMITYNGETLHIREWAEKLGVSFSSIHTRIYVQRKTGEEALHEIITGTKIDKVKDPIFGNMVKEKLKSEGRTQRWLVNTMIDNGLQINDYQLSEKLKGKLYFKISEMDFIRTILVK